MGKRRSSTRVAILDLMKQRGPLTAQAIAEAQGITPVAVRKHLEILMAEAVVSAKRTPLPRGRPSNVYSLTDSSGSEFPRSYDRLAVDLLQELAALDGEEKLHRLFSLRNERLWRDYQTRLGGRGSADLLVELVRVRDEDGYMAVLEERDGSFVLREHNCPIIEVALRYHEACKCEEELLRRVLNRDVSRESSITEGSTSCRYRIAPEG